MFAAIHAPCCAWQQNHELLREQLNIKSIIPAAIGRPTQKLPTGKWRWLMATHFDDEAYGQRWQSETVMFMPKSCQGEALGARSDAARNDEMALMAAIHNLMIIVIAELFYRARTSPFPLLTVDAVVGEDGVC